MNNRAVYCMNLKDNRTGSNEASSHEKFDFCLEQQVIGIGWASDEGNFETNQAFIDAKKYMSSLKAGDLVWIREPGKDMYYIAEIMDGELYTPTDPLFSEHDLGYCLNCKFYKVGTRNDIPMEYNGFLNRLVTPQTIQPRTDVELIAAVNNLWLRIVEREEQETKNNHNVQKKRVAEIIKKYKILFIALLCVIIGIAAFFIVHEIVYNSVSENARNEMNEKLCGKTFVQHTDEDTMDVVIIKNENDTSYASYNRTMYDISEKSAEIQCDNYNLSYDYSFWGNITAVWIDGKVFSIDSQENNAGFGDYSLATDEDLATIKAIDDRLKTKCKLSDFMMTLDEYRTAYKASGMPVSDKLIDLDLKDMVILYNNKKIPEYVIITDNGVPDKNTVRVASDSANGKIRGYDYMMRPILLYLKNIPGALTDRNEILDRWKAVEEEPSYAGEIVSEFTHNGITYYKSESSTDLRMFIEIRVNKNHIIYLADYPEFIAK